MHPEQLRQRVWPVQLATLVKQVPDKASRYVYELKFDGYRIVAVKAGRAVRLFSRSAQDWTAPFEAIAEAVASVRSKEFVVDGEVCALDERGVPRFQLLQNRGSRAAPLAYFIFDVLWVSGEDLRPLVFEARRERLERLLGPLPSGSPLTLSSASTEDPTKLLKRACRTGYEGVVAKEKGSTYEGGRRPTWLKIKCTLRQEFAIAGYVPFLGKRVGEVGSLILALKEEDGALHYAGSVGTGFTNETRRTIGRRLEAHRITEPPIAGAPRLGGSERWSRPRLVGEVAFAEWTDDGHVRHPSFQGLRKDKTVDECVRERPK